MRQESIPVGWVPTAAVVSTLYPPRSTLPLPWIPYLQILYPYFQRDITSPQILYPWKGHGIRNTHPLSTRRKDMGPEIPYHPPPVHRQAPEKTVPSACSR